MTIIQKGERMSDLISRQAAIDEAEEWIEIAYCERGRQRERDAIRHVIKGIKKLPSVQPEPCSDAISRQAAIRWVKTECNPYGKPTLDFESGKRVMEHLKIMPSVQPVDKDINVSCKDAISRQGAIDICNNVIDLWQGQLGEGALVAIKNAINNLPSVQPDVPDINVGDMISRQGAMDGGSGK